MSRLSATTRRVACALVLAALAGLASAQYPARPLRLVVPYPVGGNADVVARILGNEMAKGLGQHIVVESRPGAGSTIGADAAHASLPALLQGAKAAPERVKFGSAGPGLTQHLTGELLARMAGVRFLSRTRAMRRR
jgi:tripartite-type tricarboxylate transporter receptor subunit TctC